MIHLTPRWAYGLVLAWCCWSVPAAAFTHIVQPGDTLASIAERFYGKIQNENLLVVANALEAQGGIRITPGMRLEVPALTYIRITKGESWKSLGQRMLGGEHRAHALASANDTKPWLPPDTDAEVVVPYNLRFIATGNETLVGLAYRFLGDRKMGWMLDQYNQRKGRRLQRGDVLLIPVIEIELTAAGKRAATTSKALTSRQAGGRERDAQAKVRAGLSTLKSNIRGGRYVSAVQLGNSYLASGVLAQRQRAGVRRLLVEAYVALGAEGLAREACTLWLEEDADAKLDPVLVSPKILRACTPEKK